jgi:hypothetical protein
MVLEIMIVVIMLMYTVSLTFQLPPCVTIHNQCSNIKLVSSICFGNGAVYPKLSDQRIDIGTKMSVSFEINATRYDFEGALLFKLKRYSNSQHNMDVSTTKTNNDEVAHIYILAAWTMTSSRPFVHVVLVEHTKEFTWSEEKLKKLYNKNHDQLKEYDNTISGTWFIDDNTTLKTTFRAGGCGVNFGLNIFVSEEEKDVYAMRPLYINLER